MTTYDDEISPHSREAPPWTDCGDPASPDYGAVYAWRAAGGALALTFDRRGCATPSPCFPAPVRARRSSFTGGASM
jgi:hypothetical protein